MLEAKEKRVFFFYLRRCGNFGEKGVIIIRDDFQKEIIKVRGKRVVIRKVISGEEVLIEVKKSRANLIPLKHSRVIQILDRGNSVGPSMNNSGEVEKSRISISLLEPFFSGFLFP